MRRYVFLTTVTLALCASVIAQQDSGEQLIKKALEGREVLVKMDLPAVETGITMTFDDAKVSYDEAAYKKLLKEYGSAIPSGTRARITDVRVSGRGIELSQLLQRCAAHRLSRLSQICLERERSYRLVQPALRPS